MNLIRKVLALAVGEGLARILGVVLFAALARILPIDDFGLLTFAMSAALLAAVVIDMGQNAHIGRMIARSEGELTHAFARVAVYKSLAGAAMIGVMAAALLLMGFNRTQVMTGVWFMLWGTALSILDSLRAVLRAVDRMAADSWVNTMESVARVVAVGIVWALGGSVDEFALGFACATLAAAIATYVLVSRTVRLVPSRQEWAVHGRFLRDAVPIGLIAVASAGFYRIDQVFILPLAGSYESAIYGAAARVVFTLTVAATLISSASYPRLCRLADDAHAYSRALRSSLGLAVGVAFSLALGLWLSAGIVVDMLYGDTYVEAVGLIRILAGVIAFNGVTSIALYSANALHRERRVLPAIGLLTIGSAAANFALLGEYGAVAAAWISVVGEALLALVVIAVSRDRLRTTGPRMKPKGATAC